jgi:uncharacterized protein with ParB-like and HNH nuclease domain
MSNRGDAQMQPIRSEDCTLARVFQDFYVVPDYQREYVWQDKQVNQLLEDILEEFEGGDGEPPDYFIGTILVCQNVSGGGELELIDGQQRITTVYVILCAIRDYLKEIAPQSEIRTLKDQIAATDIDATGHDRFRYRVVLQYPDGHGVLASIASPSEKVEEDLESTASVMNLIGAYGNARQFLRTNFGKDEERLRKFYAYLTKRVKLIRVNTENLAHALKVFETINDRGIGLNSMDLLKNLMFMQASKDQFQSLKNQWKQLVDTLHRAGEKPLRFLRYFVMSRYKTTRVLREDEIYSWFVENKSLCGYSEEPLEYVALLLENARAYVNFASGKDKAGNINRYLDNVSYLSGQARQHLILLLAGQDLPSESFTELCRQIENLFFCYVITREPTREFERNFAAWANDLRQIRERKDLDAFIRNRIGPAIRERAGRFEYAFGELSEESIQRYRMLYILAKLSQHIDERAYGSAAGMAGLSYYINRDIHVEHILPQKPTEAVLAAFDRPDEYHDWKIRLGNLTLLEKSINTSVGNHLFHEKQKAYSQSKILLSKSLAGKPRVGANTAIDQAVSDLPEFLRWDSEAILKRQEFLTLLARKTWDVPAAGAAKDGKADIP